MVDMSNPENDADDQAIRALMEQHGISEAEVRISLAINAHSAKNTNDVRAVARRETLLS
jgi:hypothetical protein